MCVEMFRLTLIGAPRSRHPQVASDVDVLSFTRKRITEGLSHDAVANGRHAGDIDLESVWLLVVSYGGYAS
jgi:hypothetical protein